MKNEETKKIAVGLLLGVVFYTSSSSLVQARTFDFNIRASIESARNNHFRNRATTSFTVAQTYTPQMRISGSKSAYRVELRRLLRTYQTTNILADGMSHNRSFGIIADAQYSIRVVKWDNVGDRIMGWGEIRQ